MSSSTNSNTAGERAAPLLMPKAGASYGMPEVHTKGKSPSDMSKEAADFIASLPLLLYDHTPDGIASGRLVHVALLKAGLFIVDPILKTPLLMSPYPGTFPSYLAFLDFAHRALTGMYRWLDGQLQDDETIVGLVDMALLDQDSPSTQATKARAFYTPASYFGWKHLQNNGDLSDYLVHAETDAERLAFFRDTVRCRSSMFLHFEGRQHWTGVFADHAGGRILYFDSAPADAKAGAARVRLLLAEFFSVNGHPRAADVRTWDIRLVTSFRQRDAFSCGPAVAEFFRTIYREQKVGLHESSHMGLPNIGSGGHICPAGDVTACIKSGWRDAIGAILNIGLASNTSPLLGQAGGSRNMADAVTKAAKELKLKENTLGKHLESGFRRILFKNSGVRLQISNKAGTLTNMSTGQTHRSQGAPSPGRAAIPDTRPNAPPGSGATQQSAIDLTSTTSSRSASGAQGAADPDVSMLTRSMSSIDIHAASSSLLDKLRAADRAKTEAIRRRATLVPGSTPWMVQDEKVASLTGSIRCLLDELTKRNED